MTELHRIVGAPWRREWGRIHRSPRRRGRGQSLVEFALVLPVFLLIILTAIDFGRAYYSWVTVTNAARVAANYASIHPTADFPNDTEYQNLVRNDALNSTCPVSTAPSPTLSGPNIGDNATVTISCTFRMITPVISQVVGTTIQIRASSTFQIRTGASQ